ncbi:uncharacterized protein MONOS_744 [Monocercomonoides exilis]|uniref:uncharacterized protein n=1 Tax=Monocercomonoides exilis TaxID=2049356 RepID=UPI00355979EE|nr:hypothetical protein MONOS_744 [Monocercomonoides exilis]|eukprot:MONOS_744.1-p1 / transcript=MONOS_744.1 / gene=MONOS_744 / organism=Monocercomonoides_exilis_PA203 / gene_product=unspecified product / transcript_product=unspecified product / location=Mono_scaffold00012:204506-205177(-) / protein_length=224 / sequence_SO=supercontig / SO=protein_coding / is_pseudo=false
MLSRNMESNKPFLLTVKMLREKCTAFTLSSRTNRLEIVGPFNEALAERNAFLKEHKDQPWRAPQMPIWENISDLDNIICLPPELCTYGNFGYSQTQCHSSVNMDEEIPEIEKEDDTGTHLLGILDDIIEESGLRDLVEAIMLRQTLPLYLLQSRTTPKLEKAGGNMFGAFNSRNIYSTPVVFARPSDVTKPFGQSSCGYAQAFATQGFGVTVSSFGAFSPFLT